jgi:biopolymer transport protein TolR
MAAEFLTRYGGGGRRRASYRPLSEINVTPFVDVMLVLLIVFMVTAPLLTVGVPVDLPKVKAKSIAESEEPLVITVNAEGAVFIQDTEVAIENLVPRLKAITENKADTRIYLRGDKDINYGPGHGGHGHGQHRRFHPGCADRRTAQGPAPQEESEIDQ